MIGRILAVTLVVVAAGCGQTDDEGAPAELTATDLAFVELAIPQNESVLALLDVARGRGADNSELLGMVDAGHRSELAELRAVLTASGRVDTKQHEGHDMPGMITAAELTAIAEEYGPSFDERVDTALRTHFEEALTVVRAELTSGSAAKVLALGADIERARAYYLTRLL